MSWLIEIYGFLAVLLRGLNLTLEAVTVGGVGFLTPCPADPACRRLLRWSASLLAAASLAAAGLSALVLRASADDFSWTDALLTTFSLSHLLIAMARIAMRRWLRE